MTTPVQTIQPSSARAGPAPVDSGGAMLVEVTFKWLMAGQGWWIDTARFHSEPSYAADFIRLAKASTSADLRECAAQVEAEILARDETGAAVIR